MPDTNKGERVRRGWESFTFRLAGADDVETLARTRVEFMADVNKDMADELKADLYERNVEYFTEAFREDSFSAYLAFDGERLAATSGVTYYKTPPNKRNRTGMTAYISNMYTRAEYRGNGLATRLFELTMEDARRRGCNKAVLAATEMGRPIYEKYGFFSPDGVMEYYL